MPAAPELNNDQNPNIVVLNPADGAPAPIVPPEEEAPVVEAPHVEPEAPKAEVKTEDKPLVQGEDLPASHPVYYETVNIAGDDSSRLMFKRPLTAEAPPPAVRALRRQIEDVSRLARTLFQDDPARRKTFIDQLKEVAESGLVGRNSSVEVGLESLQDVKDSIADAYVVIRGRLWWWNVALLGGAIAYCGVGAAALKFWGSTWLWAATTGWQAWVAVALLMPLGAMAGLFIEFIFRVNDDIPYEQLRAINPGRWKPFQRALNTTIVAIIFAAILAVPIIQVGVSGVLLNEFSSGKPWLSVVIGFVTGFSFPYVRDLVQQVRPVSKT